VSSIAARDGNQINVENNMWFSTTLNLDGGGSGSGLDGGTLGNWKEIDVGSAFVDTIGALTASEISVLQPIKVDQVILSSITDKASSITIQNADVCSMSFSAVGDVITTGTRYINTQTQNGVGGLASHLMNGNGQTQMTATQQITTQTEIFQALAYTGADNTSLVINQGTSTIAMTAELGFSIATATYGAPGNGYFNINSASTIVEQGSLQLGASTIMKSDPGFAEVAFYNAKNQSTSQILAKGLAIQDYDADPNFGYYTRLTDNRAAYVNSNFSTNRLAYTVDSNLAVSSFTVSSINGVAYAGVQDWAMYSANTNVNAGGYNITGADTIAGNSVSTTTGVFSTIQTGSVFLPNPGIIQTTASKMYISSYDAINLQADGTVYVGDGGSYRGTLDTGTLDAVNGNIDSISTAAITVSTINNQPVALPFSGGQFYRSSNQNLPTGNNNLIFDSAKAWNSLDFVQTDPSTFVCSTTGTYQIGLNTTVLAATGTWTNVIKSLTIQQDRGGAQSVVINTTSVTSPFNYGQSASALIDINQGDSLRFITGQTLATGSTISLGLANVFDYNTFWDYQRLR
jgi:hypothetical protein